MTNEIIKVGTFFSGIGSPEKALERLKREGHIKDYKLETLKQYFEQIKANKLKDSLRILGINPNIDSIQTLIETTNKRIKKLENKRTFNKEEVEI